MSGGNRHRSLLSGSPAQPWPDGVVYHGARGLVVFLLGVLLVALFPSDTGVAVGRYSEGTVAQRDLIAEVDFPVFKDADVLGQEKEAAAASVVPVFIFQESAADSAVASMTTFFARIDSAAATAGTTGLNDVLAASGVDATPEQVQLLASRDGTLRLYEEAAAAIRRYVPRGVMAPEAASQVMTDSIRVVRNGAESVAARSSVLSGREFYDLVRGDEAGPETELLRMLLALHLNASLIPDDVRITRERDAARDTVPVVVARVLEGEAIVRANEQVGQAELQKLRAYRARLVAEGINVDGSDLLGALGGLLLGTLVLGFFGFLILFFQSGVYQSFRSVLTIVGIFTIYFLVASLVARQELPSSALPIVFVAVSLAILWDGRLALISVFVLSFLTALQAPFADMPAFLTVLAGGATAALVVRTFRRLSQTWVFIAVIAAAYAVALAGLYLRGAEFDVTDWLLGALGSTVVGTILAIGFLPVFEWLTGTTTDQTLIGWGDPNQRLVRRLAKVAPGTYAHTRNVASLAEDGADAIGANALLCRAGAYFHDIGKMLEPAYFIENQHGSNPHDRLDPQKSAAIIRDHVVEGVKMAKADKVPAAVIDFIAEHHGDQTVSFFLEQARRDAEEKGLEPPDPGQFRYPGPRPRSRETAITMLADSVESASRALKHPTEERTANLIENVFAKIQRRGQLQDSPLTLRDLAVLKARFAVVLGGILHVRISYPSTRHLTAEKGARPATAVPETGDAPESGDEG